MGKIIKTFYNKKEMINYIYDPDHREHELLNDDFDEYCRFNKLPKNIEKWDIVEIIECFLGDYDWVTDKKEKDCNCGNHGASQDMGAMGGMY